VLVFDLEDAVAPASKADARAAVNDVLADPEFDPDAEVAVRVTPAGVAADDDLAAVLDGAAADSLDALVLPKADAAADVDDLARLMAEHGVDYPVFAIVESAAGVLAGAEIAAADATDALVFGAEDFAADLGGTRTDAGTEVLYAREHVVLAASAAGVDAIDTLHTDFEDEAGLREDTDFAIELGYDGKLAIHPAQVGPINEAFTPDDDRLAWAERVLAAHDEAAAEGRGVFEVDGEMVDAPLVAQAERVIELAEAAGKR